MNTYKVDEYNNFDGKWLGKRFMPEYEKTPIERQLKGAKKTNIKERIPQMNEKITFYKRRKHVAGGKTPSIRVQRDQYEKIADICAQTDLTMNMVTTQLVRFALQHVEVLEDLSDDDQN